MIGAIGNGHGANSKAGQLHKSCSTGRPAGTDDDSVSHKSTGTIFSLDDRCRQTTTEQHSLISPLTQGETIMRQPVLLASIRHDRHWNTADHDSDQWASTDRGWSFLEQHPDLDESDEYYSLCCGNYLDYGQVDDGYYKREHPEGTVHAVAYVHRVFNPLIGGQSCVHLGSGWFATPYEATDWIEQQVTTYLQRAGVNHV